MPLSRLKSFGSFSNLLEEDILEEEQQQQPSRGGGRRPGKLDQTTTTDDNTTTTTTTNEQNQQQPKSDDDDDDDDDDWYFQPSSSPEELRLIVVQITDVYTLDNFASLKTLLQELRQAHSGEDNTKIISVLTGDFLSPYLLSSIDRGQGMMEALVSTPIDYLIWGNHEADIDHATACRHVEYFTSSGGIWLNTNMQSHDAMEFQKSHDVIELSSSSCSSSHHKRRVGLLAVLSNDPALYAHFPPPGAFGGAKIYDPWETLETYKHMLEQDQQCDVVLPLQHLYVPDDIKTCKQFDFPVLLSGHDHHKVDQVIHGTRLLKPGMDGVYATILELSWKDNNSSAEVKPTIRSTFVRTSNWSPCPILKAQTNRAYDVLLPLRNTQLMDVLPQYEPLSSVNARGCVCTMGIFICSLLKAALNSKNCSEKNTANDCTPKIDAVILMGGNIRGGTDYPLGSFFSLEILEAEIKSDEVVGIVSIPGAILEEGILCTHAGDPKPGWMQYDDGIRIDESNKTLTHVADEPFDKDRIYTVATKISDLGNGQSPPFVKYFTEHPEGLPAKGSYFNIPTELMGFVARHLFRKVWEVTGIRVQQQQQQAQAQQLVQQQQVEKETDSAAAAAAASAAVLSTPTTTTPSELKKVHSGLRLQLLDQNGDGQVTVEEIHTALRDLLGLSVHPDEMTLAKYIHSFADRTGDGFVTQDDLELYLDDDSYLKSMNPTWEAAFPNYDLRNRSSSAADDDDEKYHEEYEEAITF